MCSSTPQKLRARFGFCLKRHWNFLPAVLSTCNRSDQIKAMDKLKSEQERLCMWLSDDPDHIISQCEDILSLKDSREIEKQRDPPEKVKVLLQIMIAKGKEACQSFLDILEKQQEHYKQLKQLFSPEVRGSHTPTVVADGTSVVTTREISKITAKSLSMRVEPVNNPGASTSGTVVGWAPQAQYSAFNGSVICADKITDITIDGDIDLSVSMQTSQVRVGAVDETPSSSQYTAVRIIKQHKVELIACLGADHSFILQHVHASDIVTDREYNKLKDSNTRETAVIELIDQVISKGQNFCSRFIQVLKKPEILRTYPQLEEMTKKWC